MACDGAHKCRGETRTCPSDKKCAVACACEDHDNVCRDLDVDASAATELEVTFKGDRAQCGRDAEITCPTSDAESVCKVQCGDGETSEGAHMCRGLKLIGGAGALKKFKVDCSECGATGCCSGATIDACPPHGSDDDIVCAELQPGGVQSYTAYQTCSVAREKGLKCEVPQFAPCHYPRPSEEAQFHWPGHQCAALSGSTHKWCCGHNKASGGTATTDKCKCKTWPETKNWKFSEGAGKVHKFETTGNSPDFTDDEIVAGPFAEGGIYDCPDLLTPGGWHLTIDIAQCDWYASNSGINAIRESEAAVCSALCGVFSARS